MDQQEVTVKNYGTTGQVSSSDLFKKPDKLLGIRHLQTLLMFLCLTIAYALRVILSVAIVAMVDMEANDGFPHYNWEKPLPDTILSSFFWGYVVTQVPAGQLAQRFGPKILLTIAVAACSVFSILTPLAADVGDWGMVCGCRVIQGLGQGFIFPSIHTLISSWTPTGERGRLATYVYAGAQFGTIIALGCSGVLASSSIGWPSIFYIFGTAGVLWAILWFFLGADSPATHRSISDEEKQYIENSLGSQPSTDSNRSTPWIAIFTSMPMWALIIAHCGQNWGFWTLLTEMPSYMKDVLEFDIKSNGLLSALPYFVMWLMSFVFSWFSDFFNRRKMVSLAVSRKIFNTIGHWIPGVALIGLAYIPKGDNISPVALLTLAVGVNSATYLGFQLNHIDLSPNYAGTMMGITNCAANIMSIIGPLLVGVVVTDNKSVTQWRTIFFIASGIYFAGNLVFILFGKATIQPWNEPQPSKMAANNIAMEEGISKDKDKDKDIY